jgi:hypothetical protein
MVMNWKGFERKRSWPERGSYHSRVGTERKHENLHSGYPVSQLRFEPRISECISRASVPSRKARCPVTVLTELSWRRIFRNTKLIVGETMTIWCWHVT